MTTVGSERMKREVESMIAAFDGYGDDTSDATKQATLDERVERYKARLTAGGEILPTSSALVGSDKPLSLEHEQHIARVASEAGLALYSIPQHGGLSTGDSRDQMASTVGIRASLHGMQLQLNDRTETSEPAMLKTTAAIARDSIVDSMVRMLQATEAGAAIEARVAALRYIVMMTQTTAFTEGLVKFGTDEQWQNILSAVQAEDTSLDAIGRAVVDSMEPSLKSHVTSFSGHIPILVDLSQVPQLTPNVSKSKPDKKKKKKKKTKSARVGETPKNSGSTVPSQIPQRTKPKAVYRYAGLPQLLKAILKENQDTINLSLADGSPDEIRKRVEAYIDLVGDASSGTGLFQAIKTYVDRESVKTNAKVKKEVEQANLLKENLVRAETALAELDAQREIIG